MAVKGTHFSNTMDGNRESMRLAWEAMNEGVIALRLGRLAASNAQLNAATMAASAAANFSCVTDLADLLVQRNGLSFREAHHVTGRIVRLAEEKNVALEELSLEDMRRIDRRITKAVFSVLGVDKSVASRTSFGGTAPINVARAVKAARKRYL